MLPSLFPRLKKSNDFNKKVVFLHIPKTGGTTLRTILREHYRKSYCRCTSLEFGEVLKTLAEFQCIEFHIAKREDRHFYPHREIVQKSNWKYLQDKALFSMFRNPVDRVVSAYFEKLRREKLEHSPALLAKFIEDPGTHNLQISFLLGIHPSTKKFPGLRELNDAKKMLKRLKIQVGILESFEKSLHSLQFVTGKKILPREIRVENATPGNLLSLVDHSSRERIREKNHLDQQLYEYAVKVFEQQHRRISRHRPVSINS